MKIFYIGASGLDSTSRHRADALKRLGHEIVIADPYLALGWRLSNKVLSIINYRTGYRFLSHTVYAWLCSQLVNINQVDVIWIDSGELFGPDSVNMLGANGRRVVLYNHDDPTGSRDGHRFDLLVKSLPFFSVCAVVREQNVYEYYEAGAKKVIRVWRSYDEVLHAPNLDVSSFDKKFIADVVFVGTWMRGEGRDEFLLRLINAGITVRIWGARWSKSPYWSQLKAFYGGGALSGREYVAALQCAKVCLGFLSSGNRDLHTTRSMEIPYAGGVFCAERTPEHQQLYEENIEAVFWGDVEECISQCKRLVADDSFREAVRAAGMRRVRLNKVGHEDQCQIILDEVALH